MMKSLCWIAPILLTGCVQAGTRYVSNDTAIVSARGNGFSSVNQVQQSVLAEAAKSTIARGYTHFSIVDSADASGYSYYQPAATAQTTGTINAYGYGNNATATYQQQTTYNNPSPIPIFKPGMDVAIHMYREGDAPTGAFRAADYVQKKH